MDLRDYFRILRRSWVLIAAFTLAGLLAGAGIALLTKPTYTANTQLFVAIQNSGTVQELQQGNTFSQARVQSYVKTAVTPIVLQPAIDSLGLGTTPGELAARVKATNEVNTVLISISATDNSPARAAAIAQAVAVSLVKVVDTLEKPLTGGDSPVRLSVVTPAIAPSEPSAPNSRLAMILGFLLGMAAGLGTAMLRSLMDNKIRGEADLRRLTDTPILGGIAFDQAASARPLLTDVPAQSPRAESFRQLRTNLQFANVSGAARSILITSSLPGEGKSTTATNLAIAIAQGGQSVCLVDADLRRPMVGDYLGIDRHAGLTTALIGKADIDDLLHPWGDDSLFVLASGAVPPNPSELLGSQQMNHLLRRLEDAFDVVIIDAPPLLPVTDAAVLAQQVGGVVMVAGSQKVKRHDLERSLNALNMVGVEILGIVLNRLPSKGRDAYAYSYYSSDTSSETRMTATSSKASGSRSSRRRTKDADAISAESGRQGTRSGDSRRPSKFPVGLSEGSGRQD